MSSPVRVRFAPSPTGHLHVGGLRTALYNYLFAKKHGGEYILRIEDTDQKRLVPEAVEGLIACLEEVGVKHTEGVFLENGRIVEKGDFGPYIQSLRLPLYTQYAEELIASGKAYACFCSAERLNDLRAEQNRRKEAPKYDKHCLKLTAEEREKLKAGGNPFVVRLNVPEHRGAVIFTDLVRGEVSFDSSDIDDQVLMKSDGFPTYHLANVVDDYLMQITHVVRGEEWLPSTPKHVLLYEAFNWPLPIFAHLPLLLNPDKSKLSKRQGDVAVKDYMSKGYLSEALVNFVALLGWNPGQGNTQEIFSLEELVASFTLENVHKSGAVFDLKKLDWMNAEYIKKLSVDELYNRAQKYGHLDKEPLLSAPETMRTEEYLRRVLTVEQERLATLAEIGLHNPFFFTENVAYDPKLLNWKDNSVAMTKQALEKASGILTELNDIEWGNKEILEKILLEAAGEKRGDFLWPLRVALTGAERSPSPFEVAWVLGKIESLKRLEKALYSLK